MPQWRLYQNEPEEHKWLIFHYIINGVKNDVRNRTAIKIR